MNIINRHGSTYVRWKDSIYTASTMLYEISGTNKTNLKTILILYIRVKYKKI